MLGSLKLKQHGEKVFNAIDTIIRDYLTDVIALETFLIKLGRVHYHWGVREEHFPVPQTVSNFFIAFRVNMFLRHFIDNR